MTDTSNGRSNVDTEANYQVWTQAKPIITKEMVEKITEKASLLTKARLFRLPSKYSIDGDCIIRYKEMDGVIYIMKRGTHL